MILQLIALEEWRVTQDFSRQLKILKDICKFTLIRGSCQTVLEFIANKPLLYFTHEWMDYLIKTEGLWDGIQCLFLRILHAGTFFR